MHLYIVKAWFRKRWHVYEMGHLEGDWYWLATFASAAHASEWVHDHSGFTQQFTKGE